MATDAERITKIEAQIDALQDAIAAGTAVPGDTVSYIQDPNGGQIAYRDPYDTIQRLLALRDTIQAASDKSSFTRRAYPVARRKPS